MTAHRARAYGRVIRALRSSDRRDLAPAHQELLREAADTLLFAPRPDEETRLALARARAVLLAIRASRFDPWLDQLADDLEDCGPAPLSLTTIWPQRSQPSPVAGRSWSSKE